MIDSHTKILLDLDRTLFDTGLFVETLWKWIGRTYGVDEADGRARLSDYFTYVDDMYSYDFFAHIHALGIDDIELVSRAQADLADNEFIFTDALVFLDKTSHLERVILTFGEERYQHFKISLCPALSGLPVYTTLRPKKYFIAQQWASEPVVMIDDKLLDGTLPDSAQFIHVDRKQTAKVVDHGTYTRVRSLSDIVIKA